MQAATIRSFEDAAVREFLEVMLPEQGALGVYGALHAAAVPVELFVDLNEGAYAYAAAEVVAVAYGQGVDDMFRQLPSEIFGVVNDVAPEVRDLPKVRGLALSVLERLQMPNSAAADQWLQDRDWMIALSDLKKRLEACV
jgi:hypothetical protein